MGFVLQKTATGFKFDLKAANGETVASSEVYASRAGCVKGMKSVAACAPTAPVADLTAAAKLPPNPRFELFTDRGGAYRFRLRGRNGKILVFSQGYASRAACENGVESVGKNAIYEEKQTFYDK